MADKRKELFEKVLFLLIPFLLSIVPYLLSGQGSQWKDWLVKCRIVSYLILFVTIVLIITNKFRKDYFYLWLGFSLYFSSLIIIGDMLGLPRVASFMNYSPIIISDIAHPLSNIFPSLFFFINAFCLFCLFQSKLLCYSVERMFHLICVYYYLYCLLIAEQYFVFVNNALPNIQSALKLFVMVNLFLSVLYFLIVFNKENKKHYGKLFGLYLLLNCFALNLTTGAFRIENAFTLTVYYLQYFVLYSNLIYYLLFIIVIKYIVRRKSIQKDVLHR